MSPPWIVFATALFVSAALGPYLEPSARATAIAGVAAVLVRSGRGRSGVLLISAGVLLGGQAAARIAQPLAAVHAVGVAPVEARFVVTAALFGGRAEGWVQASSGPPLRARLSGLPPTAGPGARGQARMRLSTVGPPRNPDDRDPRRQALAGRTLVRARVQGDAVLDRASAPASRQRLKDDLVRSWAAGMGAGAQLWAALLLGERIELDPEVDDRFRALGQTHLLSISGTHVALVAGLALALTRRMVRVRVWLPLTLVVVWTCLVGFIPPLARAVGMAAWVTAARRLGRPARAIDALAAVGLVELAWRPWHLAGLTWWLSYAATAGLCLAVRALAGRPRWLQGIGVSLAAQGATLPWMLGTFGSVPWAATAHYMVLGPVFGVLMAAGVGLTLLAALLPPLAPAALALLAVATHAAGFVMWALSRVTPDALAHPGLAGAAWAAALALLAIWLVPGLAPWRRARVLVTASVTLLIHANVWIQDAARWTMLDVGQGDATVLRVAGRHWLVVDAGPASPRWDAGTRIVVPYLQRRNARGVTLALTHGHLDHTGGTEALLRTGRVARLVLAACDTAGAWGGLLREVAARHGAILRPLARGDTLWVGDVRIDCWWPPADAGDLHTNDRSLVLTPLLPGGLILTGDLERIGERALVAQHPFDPRASLRAAMLKVAHHGGNTGTDDAWLEQVQPSLAWISCGTGNRYGHPHDLALERLAAHGAVVWRTDRDGALSARWRGGRIHVRATLREREWRAFGGGPRGTAEGAGRSP